MQKELHFNLLMYFPCNFSIMPPIMMKNRLFAVYTTYPNKQAKNPRVQLCKSLEYHLLASCGSPVLFKSSERNRQQSSACQHNCPQTEINVLVLFSLQCLVLTIPNFLPINVPK